LNESDAVPVPVVCENLMVIGFVDQIAFGGELVVLVARTES